MTRGMDRGDDLFLLESAVWVWTRPVGVPIYDFEFDRLMACRRPYARPAEIVAVARVGALDSYETSHADLLADGVRLIHDPEQNLRATRLPRWYPLLADLTPRSLWFEGAPDPKQIEEELGWPIFMKGARQTSRHRRKLSIITGPDQLERALDVVCRSLVSLRPVEDPDPERIPSSYEFRTFWWHGELVGCGRYWWEGVEYELTAEERGPALDVAREAARRVDVPFLVVDVAQRIDGAWIVIECNDGQESGYAGVSPFTLWREVVRLEQERRGA